METFPKARKRDFWKIYHYSSKRQLKQPLFAKLGCNVSPSLSTVQRRNSLVITSVCKGPANGLHGYLWCKETKEEKHVDI